MPPFLILLLIMSPFGDSVPECDSTDLSVKANADKCVATFNKTCPPNLRSGPCFHQLEILMNSGQYHLFEEICVANPASKFCTQPIELLGSVKVPQMHKMCPNMKGQKTMCKMFLEHCAKGEDPKELGCINYKKQRQYVICRDTFEGDCEPLCDRKIHKEYQVGEPFADVCVTLLDKKCEKEDQCQVLMGKAQFASNNTSELEQSCANKSQLGNGCQFLVKILLDNQMTFERFSNLKCLPGKPSAFCEVFVGKCLDVSKKTSPGCVDFFAQIEPVVLTNPKAVEKYKELDCAVDKTKSHICELILSICNKETSKENEQCARFRDIDANGESSSSRLMYDTISSPCLAVTLSVVIGWM